MIAVYIADVSPLFEQTVYESCYRASSPARREKAEKLAVAADRARCIGAGLLLEEACRDFLHTKEKQTGEALSDSQMMFAGVLSKQVGGKRVVVKYPDTEWIANQKDRGCEKTAFLSVKEGNGEKPFFCTADGQPDLSMPYFSISHSGDFVGCAISFREVGFDLQACRGVPEAVLCRIFSEPEQKRIRESANPPLAFAAAWSALEAAAKLKGSGIAGILEAAAIPGSTAAGIFSECRNGDSMYSDYIEERYAWSVAWSKQ